MYILCMYILHPHTSLNQPHTNVCNAHARQYVRVLSLLFTGSHLSRLRELDRANRQLQRKKTQRDQPKSGECQPRLINSERPGREDLAEETMLTEVQD